MAISPNSPENLAKEIGRVYAQAERDIIARIANRLPKGRSLPVSEWEAQKLSELQQLRSGIEMHIQKKLSNYNDKELEKIIKKAYSMGADSAVADLRKNLNEDEIPVTEGFGKTHQRAIRKHTEALNKKLSATHLRIVRQADDVYRKAVSRGAQHVLTGAGDRIQGSQIALNEFADKGVTGFVDDAGRSWNLQSYTEMATRTNTAQAALEGHMNRMKDNGQDLVVVSAHAESCPICDPWEGQILSISGNDDRYPSVDEAIEDGLYHPNCGHNMTAYIEGLTETPEPQPGEEDYEDRQQQRYLERGARKWKRREAAAMTDEEQEKAKEKVREWQGRLREFTDEKDRRRKYEREQIEQAR